MEPKNPITEVRERLGAEGDPISRADLAKRTGCDYGILSHAELGYLGQLPPSVLKALDGLGLDPAEANRMYAEWRKTFQQAAPAAA